jgi:hypothetical protein
VARNPPRRAPCRTGEGGKAEEPRDDIPHDYPIPWLKNCITYMYIVLTMETEIFSLNQQFIDEFFGKYEIKLDNKNIEEIIRDIVNKSVIPCFLNNDCAQ